MLQSSDSGGAGLTVVDLRLAAEPDDGGHTPSEIWRSVGGDDAFAERMEAALKNTEK